MAGIFAPPTTVKALAVSKYRNWTFTPNLNLNRVVAPTDIVFKDSGVNMMCGDSDDVLKTEFDLPQGLADTSKTKVKTKVPLHGKNAKKGEYIIATLVLPFEPRNQLQPKRPLPVIQS